MLCHTTALFGNLTMIHPYCKKKRTFHGLRQDTVLYMWWFMISLTLCVVVMETILEDLSIGH